MNSIRTRADLGLLVIRLVTGLVFLMHGYQKVFVYGFAGIGDGFAKMGIPMPMVMGPAIGILETLGGIALIIGFGTRIVGLLLACDMLGAIMMVHIKNGFFVPMGVEFVLTLFAAALALALAGAGDLSVDAAMRRKTAVP
jgi:putative oxidoreductase